MRKKRLFFPSVTPHEKLCVVETKEMGKRQTQNEHAVVELQLVVVAGCKQKKKGEEYAVERNA